MLDPSWVVAWPSLGFLAADWITAHCMVPAGPLIGRPFETDGWQLWALLNHYRVRPDARLDAWGGSNATSFVYRRSLIVAPQKTGKSPLAAAWALFEAAGPCLFGGWAPKSRSKRYYRCEEHGCSCGFEYEYGPGEPMGMHRPKSLIHLMAVNEDQTANVFEPLQAMAGGGPLREIMRPREDFIRTPNNGRITPVTSASRGKIGAPLNFAVGDETGLYVAKVRKTWETIRRNLAPLGGRSVEFTNAWDPMEDSAAKATFESGMADVWVFYVPPPEHLDFMDPAQRREIFEVVYRGSPWVDLDALEAEAAELIKTDPATARRFYGNQLYQGTGAFISPDLWDKAQVGWPAALAALYRIEVAP